MGNRRMMPVGGRGNGGQSSMLELLLKSVGEEASSLAVIPGAGGTGCFLSSIQGTMTLHRFSLEDITSSMAWPTMIGLWLLVFTQSHLRVSRLCTRMHCFVCSLTDLNCTLMPCAPVLAGPWSYYILNSR